MAGCVALMLGGIVLSGCAQTISYTYPVPSDQDIGRLILEWGEIEKKQGVAPIEYTSQYAKALKALSDAIAEAEVWRVRYENK